MLKQAVIDHFEAVFGYGAWLLLILIFIFAPDKRFDSLVTVQAGAWFGSIATYITVKVIKQKPDNQPSVAIEENK
jgi:hypothetical protein